MTQGALAERAGVSRQTVAELESGRRQNSEMDTISAFSFALGVSVSDLLGRNDQNHVVVPSRRRVKTGRRRQTA
jgi:transcriptional regulator with XRE-family HTH domain